MNTNGSMFGPLPTFRAKLERVLKAGIDLIEFSMDAGDADLTPTSARRIAAPQSDPQKWCDNHVSNIRAALALRKEFRTTNRDRRFDDPPGASSKESSKPR